MEIRQSYCIDELTKINWILEEIISENTLTKEATGRNTILYETMKTSMVEVDNRGWLHHRTKRM